MPDDIPSLTLEVLKQIRDATTQNTLELQSLRAEVHDRLGAVESELGQVRQGLNDLGGFMRDLALAQGRHERFHAQHVEVLERDVADLRKRLEVVERRLAE
jgi:hypothetical protein